MSGPALLFLALEQGTAFASEAARAVLVSLVGVAGCALAYAWTALRAPWWVSLPASWTVFFAAVLLAQRFDAPVGTALALAVLAIAIARQLLPQPGAHAPATRPAWDLPVRMVAAMTLVVSVTALAERLGPTLSGALTPFPVAVSILLGFSHAQQGGAAAVSFLRGFLPGMWSFAAFCFVLSVGIGALGTLGAFVAALAIASTMQAAVLWAMRRRLSARRLL